MRNFIASIIVGFTALVATAAQAGDFTIGYYENGETYLQYTGNVLSYDKIRLQKILKEVNELVDEETQEPITFSRDLWLDSPGGQMMAAIELAEMINNAGLITLVDEADCASGCALMWLAGTERWIGEEGRIGFHSPYTTNTQHFNNIKELNGWIGVQDEVSKVTLVFTGQMLRWGINDPGRFVFSLSNATVVDFVWIDYTNEVAHEIVGYHKL